MLQYGNPPYLECSTKGDKRFSPFCARVESRGGKTIESLYQAAKLLPNGVSGLSWQQAKGKRCVNQAEVAKLYTVLWDEYMSENPQLLDVLCAQTGLSDIFGKEGTPCQVTELWRIRNEALLGR